MQETQSLKNFSLPTHDAWFIPATPTEGRPSGGLAILTKKTTNWSLTKITDSSNKNFQACLISNEGITWLLINVYVPPTAPDVFNDIYLPVLDIIHGQHQVSSRLVAGDFNARIGDAESAAPDDTFKHCLPPSNNDRICNDGRPPFLSFVDLSDLFIVNGNFPSPPSTPQPANFTFMSIREKSTPTGPIPVIARSCIDFVLLDPCSRPTIQSFTTQFFPHIDHSLLKLAISRPQPPPPPPATTTLQKFRPPTREVLLSIVANFDPTSTPSHTHPMTHLISLIHDAGQWKPYPPKKSWFATAATTEHAQHVASLRRGVRKLFEVVQQDPNPVSLRAFLSSRVTWIKAVEEGQKLSLSTFQESIQEWIARPNTPGNATKLWRILTGKKSEFGCPLISEDRLVSHFEALLKTNEPLAYTPVEPPVELPQMDTPFTPEEVARVIRQKRSLSAPGEDQLQYSLWKEILEDPPALSNLTKLFNIIFATGRVPLDWRKAIVTVMYKGKGPRDLPTNFRAISLTSTSLKIFETLIANRLSSWAESKSLFTHHQAGFRRNYSTRDHIFSLAAMQQASRNRNTYVAFIDLAKAFPSISRPRLLQKLQTLGVSNKVMNVIAALYESDSYQFLLSHATLGAKTGEADKGTREGSCLSPLLFLLFVSDLPDFLAEARTLAPKFGQFLLRVLQFADDTSLVAIGRKNLQRLLNRFSEYCALNGLQINAAKTEVINLRRGARGSRKDRWQLAGEIITISKQARYLGVIFATGKKGTHHARNLRARNKEKMWGLIGRVRRGGITDTAFLLRLFHTLIVSSSTYGVGLLFPFPTHHLSKQINTLLTSYLRSIWGLPRGTPNHFVLKIANRPCLTCECHLDAIAFLSQKLKLWTMNSPLVEEILLDMYKDPYGPHWLGHVLTFLKDRMKLSLDLSSFESFKIGFLLLDRATFRAQITRGCHQICYPPSPSHSAYYQLLDLPSVSSWICFASSNRHYRLSRIFISNSFRFARNLQAVNEDHECEFCLVPMNVEHWFVCPLRAADRDEFFLCTGVMLSGPCALKRVCRDLPLLVAFEHALSKFFRSN